MGYTLSETAYSALILHAYKFQAFKVLGVLLGTAKENNVVIKESIPLFHGNVLSPMLEAALMQVLKFKSVFGFLSLIDVKYFDIPTV